MLTRVIRAAVALGAIAVAGAFSYDHVHAPPAHAKPVITVYKDPSCGCCKKWIEHLKANGYQVVAKDTNDMASVKRSLGVAQPLQSCHTAVVNGYIIEGHVAASEIDRLLAEKPKVAGLAAPGMPMGSPGMEMPGMAADHYAVVAFQKDGKSTVFAKH